MASSATVSVDLPVDADRAWTYVVDWDRQADWMLLTSVRVTEGSGQAVGDRISARTGVGPVGFTDDMVITEWAAPRECRVRHLGKIVRGDGVFAVVPTATGSRFVWSEEPVIPFGRAGAAAWRVLRPGLEVLMRLSLRRLSRQVGR